VMTLEELATWLDDFGLEVVQGNASRTDACRLRLWAAAEACRELAQHRWNNRGNYGSERLFEGLIPNALVSSTDAALSECKE
jgi:hypothetical protein